MKVVGLKNKRTGNPAVNRQSGFATQSGFTLVELIIVIVILGVLAVSALPRFLDFSGSANKAVLSGIKGAVESAASMTFFACQIDQLCNPTLPADGTSQTRVCITQSCAPGEFISTHYGYPNASNPGIVRTLNLEGIFNSSGGTSLSFYLDQTSNQNCRVRYVRATASGQKPVVSVIDSDC